jgi:hypothetical protein
MKTPNLDRRAGSAIVVAILLTFIVVVLIAIATNYTQQMGRVSKRTRAINTAMEIGDGCLEVLFSNWRNICRSEPLTFLPTNYFYTTVYHPNSQPSTAPVPALIPTPPPSAFPSAPNYPDCIMTYQIVATDPMLAPLADPYPTSGGNLSPAPAGYGPGSNQYSYYYLASADVRVPALGGDGTVTAKVRRVFEKKLNTPWTWSIFYNDVLELTPDSTLSLTGPIHTNNDLYTGSNNLTVTNTTVNGTSILGTLGYVGSWAVGYAPGDTYHTGSPTAPNYPSGQPPAQENNYLPFGWNLGQVTSITDIYANNDGYREVVEVPAAGDDPMATQRYYNQAYVRIIIDSTGNIKYYDSTGYSCTSGAGTTTQKQIYNTFNGAVAKNDIFTDNREGSTVSVSTLDLNKVKNDVNGGKLPNFNGVVYFSDQRANQTGGTPKYGLRLKNGDSLPTTTSYGVTPGLTVATDNPLYVQGDFNTGGNPPSNNSSNPDPTQPTASGYTRQPAALIADGVTILSNHWSDSASTKPLTDGGRAATNTTINAAIVAGDVPSGSSGGNYSGGAENLVRLLENWTGKSLTYYGSLVQIYHSRQAVGTWGKANVYNPPVRSFYYDANFQSTSPPGNMVLATYLQQQRWYLIY